MTPLPLMFTFRFACQIAGAALLICCARPSMAARVSLPEAFREAEQVVVRIGKSLEKPARGGGGLAAEYDPLSGTRSISRSIISSRTTSQRTATVPPARSAVMREDADLLLMPRPGLERIAVAKRGAAGRILALSGDWLRVEFENGKRGWVRAADTDYGPPRSGQDPAVEYPPSGSALLARVMGRMGDPYVWGGARPGAYDCSGLILDAALGLGLKLPHSAALQATHGAPVGRTELLPGDLVFFRNTYKPGISHVGVYAGNDRFVHASSSHGVSVSSLHKPYYASRYAGARRLSFRGN